MGYDISNLHIDERSPVGEMIERIVRREGVTPEAAIMGVLDRAAEREVHPKDIVGLFSSPEDRAIMDDVMQTIRESREREVRDMRAALERGL